MTKPKPKKTDDLFVDDRSPVSRQMEALEQETPVKARAPARAKKKAAKERAEANTKAERERVRMSAIVDPGPRVPVVAKPEPVNLLSLIGQALTNPQVDVVKLQGVIDWYDRREAKNAFDRDFLAMAPELPEIKRDGLIDQGVTRRGAQGVKARFPKYESLHEAVAPKLHEFGFSMHTRNAIHGEQTVVIVTLTHYDPRHGSYEIESVQPVRIDDSGGKTSVQAFASGEQYAIRRAVIKLLHLRSRDPRDGEDRDGNPPEKVETPKLINAAQLKELKEKIAATGGRISEKRVCEKYGLAKLEEMPLLILPDAFIALDNVIEASRG